MNPKVDFYFDKAQRWQPELEALRGIVVDCGLSEELKWGCPCYTYEGRNIVLIHVFKDYCALLFFKGALLGNAHGVLVPQSENTQATRQARFRGVGEIREREALLKACVYEAIEVEKAGLKVAFKKTTDFPVAEEFEQKLAELPELKAAFAALTPGRQRAYLLYFAAPKQSKTRQSRVEKSMARILEGRGLNES